MPIRIFDNEGQEPDSVDVSTHESKHFWRAAAEVTGLNVGLWAFDRYVTKGKFAYISPKTMMDNITHGFVWDNDMLSTNMFLHPYTGALYFNAARSNGYNFWQSECFAIAGSAMWEFLFENEYPSTNDIIATPVGGACIGEVLYRASDAVLDDRTSGAERAGREIAALFISPMRGINRLVTGQAWRRSTTTGRQFGSPQFAMQVSAGAKMLNFGTKEAGTKYGGVVRFNLEYGDRFAIKSNKPYEYFTVGTSLALMKTQPVIQHIEIKGRLLAREFLQEKDEFLSLGLYQHFDFYDSNKPSENTPAPYQTGVPASIGFGALFRDNMQHRVTFDAFLHANAVILGTCTSDHYVLDNRNYNFASGFSLKCGLHSILDTDRFALSLRDNFYRLWTWKGYREGTDLRIADERTLNAMGDKSNTIFNALSLRADIRIIPRLYATLVFEHYYRLTHYSYFPNVKATSLGAQLMLTYRI